MKYLRLFKSQSDYELEVSLGKLIRPSVNAIEKTKSVFFKPKLKVSINIVEKEETGEKIPSFTTNCRYFEETKMLRIEGGKVINNTLIL